MPFFTIRSQRSRANVHFRPIADIKSALINLHRRAATRSITSRALDKATLERLFTESELSTVQIAEPIDDMSLPPTGWSFPDCLCSRASWEPTAESPSRMRSKGLAPGHQAF